MFSNRKKYIQTANKEIINKMTGYLPIIDVYKLAATSRFFSSTINFAIVKSRPDYNIFENTKSENISIIIQKALTGIEVYLTQDVKRPTVGTRSGPGMDTTTDYSVGYRRATCFKDILADKEYHDRSVRILALYVLLQEFNGKQLKSRVKEQLGIRFLKMLDLYVHTKYSAEYINKIKK